jgi:hypothetical protein
MSMNPVQRAWLVLWAAFLGFCLLVYGLASGVPWLLQNTTAELRLELGGSDTQFQRPGLNILEAVNGPPAGIPAGSTILTDLNAQANLQVIGPNGAGTLATIQIYGDSRVKVEAAEQPRFEPFSTLPYRIRLNVERGRIRVLSANEPARPVYIEVRSAPEVLTVLDQPGSNASIESSFLRTTVSVRESQAEVSTPISTPLVLRSEQRADVTDAGAIIGPLPTERNLIVDGTFTQPLGEVWKIERRVADEGKPLGEVRVQTVEGRRSINLIRTSTDPNVGWAAVSLTQELNVDVRDFTSLRLQLDVYLTSQSLFNCGGLGTECPVMVRIRYLDLNGSERGWLQGYFDRGRLIAEQGQFGLFTCPSCSEITEPHIPIETDQWLTLDAPSNGNLLELMQARGIPAAFLRAITIYASGHQFNSNVAQIQLLATD